MPNTTCHISDSLGGFVAGPQQRLFNGIERFGFEPIEVLRPPQATHIRSRRAS